jgi:hypothetical protein
MAAVRSSTAFVVAPSKSIVVAVAANGGNESKVEGAAFTDGVRRTVNALPEP